jgi:2-polyprenyl-3-methyl-5-hydroxy-6-metoxy-1,4-benzoquinol methylase
MRAAPAGRQRKAAISYSRATWIVSLIQSGSAERLVDIPAKARTLMTDEVRKQNAEFDKFADQYRTLLDKSVAASGESGEYFANYKAQYTLGILGGGFAGTILDYGCGIGLLTGFLVQSFPEAKVIGFDPSHASIRMATPQVGNKARLTAMESELPEKVDAIMLANVMHHVPPAERQSLIAAIAGKLSPSGKLFIFEHNPANPVTHAAVRRCAFDHDAVLLRPQEVIGYIRQAQLDVGWHDYIVFFPRRLKWFRPMERLLTWCAMGAQYAVVSTPNRK